MNWQNVTVKLSDLQPWEHNPRTMTKKQAQRLLKSWKDLGQFQTIAIGPRENGSGCPVYDGHQRLSALLAAYGAQYAIDARQSDRALTEDERRYLITQANLPVGAWRFEEIAGWPEAQEWGFDAEMLKTWNGDAAALATMLEAEQPQGDADADPQIDRAAELNEKWQVQRGDLWRIGEHRLLCGDSTKRGDVERVMGGEKAQLCLTDPPYNVAYSSRGSNRDNWGKIENDEMSESDFYSWLLLVGASIDYALADGASVYLCHGDTDRHSIPFIDLFRDMKWKRSSTIIWAKQAASMGWQDYRSQHECLSYGWKNGAEHYFIDDRSETTVWTISRDSQANYEHPTQKPTELFLRAIRNSSKTNDIDIDWFAGSGTSLVACQNLQRKCRAIEISPNYCAVILERMATAFPGIEIERLEEGSNGAA